MAEKIGLEGIVRHTQSAVNPKCTINDLLHDIRNIELNGGNFIPGLGYAYLINTPYGMQGHEMGSLDFGSRFRHLLLDNMTGSQTLAILGDFTEIGAFAHKIKGAVTDA